MIYIIGYLNKNLGDDLFIRTLIRRYPNELFYICEKKAILGDLSGEKNLRYNNFFNYLLLKISNKIHDKRSELINHSIMKSSKALIIIGGSIFMERTGWQNRKVYYENENLFYIGTNFGPYYSQEYKEEIKSRLQNSKNCCFRDLYSYNAFHSLKNISYAPDVLFGYPYYPAIKKGNEIGISIINLKGRIGLEQYIDIYESGIVKICNHYLSLGKKIVLFGFCEPEGDRIAINSILNKLDVSENISTICYDGKIDDFLGSFNDCEIIYATRFHAMIIGFVMRKSVVPIIYSEKQTHVLEDLNYCGNRWNLNKGEKISEECINIKKHVICEEKIKNFVEESEKQFYSLDCFLKCNEK